MKLFNITNKYIFSSNSKRSIKSISALWKGIVIIGLLILVGCGEDGSSSDSKNSSTNPSSSSFVSRAVQQTQNSASQAKQASLKNRLNNNNVSVQGDPAASEKEFGEDFLPEYVSTYGEFICDTTTDLEDDFEMDDEDDFPTATCTDNGDGSITATLNDGSTLTITSTQVTETHLEKTTVYRDASNNLLETTKVVIKDDNETFSYESTTTDASNNELLKETYQEQKDGSGSYSSTYADGSQFQGSIDANGNFQETQIFATGEISKIEASGTFSDTSCQYTETITYRDGRTETFNETDCWDEDFDELDDYNVTTTTEADGTIVTKGSWSNGSESSAFELREHPDGTETIKETYKDEEGEAVIELAFQADGSGSGTLVENGQTYTIVINTDGSGTITSPDGTVENF